MKEQDETLLEEYEDNEEEELMNIVDELLFFGLEEDDLSEAVNIAEEYMEEHGYDFNVSYALARIALYHRDEEMAEELIKEMEEIAPGDLDVMKLRAILMVQEGEIKKMEELVEQVLSRTGDRKERLEILHQFASICMEEELLGKAVAFAKRALKIKRSNPYALGILGMVAIQRDDLDEAEKYFKKAIRISPEDFDAYLCLGMVLEKKKDIERAEAHYRSMMEIFPEYVEPYERLVFIYISNGRLHALDNLLHIADENELDSPIFYYAMARYYMSGDEAEDAVSTIKAGLKIWPYNEILNSLLPQAEIATGRVFAAMASALRNRITFQDFLKFEEIEEKEGIETDRILAELAKKMTNDGIEEERDDDALEIPEEILNLVEEIMDHHLTMGCYDFLDIKIRENPKLKEKEKFQIELEKEYTDGVDFIHKVVEERFKSLSGRLSDDSMHESHWLLFKENIEVSYKDVRIMKVFEGLEKEKRPPMSKGKITLYRPFFEGCVTSPEIAYSLFPEFLEE